MMWGTLTLKLSSFLLLSLPSVYSVCASEQQPFEFGEMSTPQYTLPPLPYAYDVSIAIIARPTTPHQSYS